MKWLKEYWAEIVITILAVVIIAMIFNDKKQSSDLTEYILKQKSDSINVVLKERDSIQKELDRTQDSVVNHMDSLLHIAINNQNKTLYELQKQREKIVVPNYDSDSLRYYFSRLRPIIHDLHTK